MSQARQIFIQLIKEETTAAKLKEMSAGSIYESASKKVRMGYRQRLALKQLESGPKHISELCKKTHERDPNLMIQSLRKLIKRGLIIRVSTGKYSKI